MERKRCNQCPEFQADRCDAIKCPDQVFDNMMGWQIPEGDPGLITKMPTKKELEAFLRGSSGKVIVLFNKDTNNLLYQMKQKGMKSYMVKATVERNENVDRVEKDWNSSKGRAVID